MRKNAITAIAASTAIEEGWDLVNHDDPRSLSPEQRSLRKNLSRRFRERRRPFTKAALAVFLSKPLNDFIKTESAKMEQ